MVCLLCCFLFTCHVPSAARRSFFYVRFPKYHHPSTHCVPAGTNAKTPAHSCILVNMWITLAALF